MSKIISWGKRLLIWAIVNPWIAFRKWLNKSRFVAFIVGGAIVGSFIFCYLTIQYCGEELFVRRMVVFNISADALASSEGRENASANQDFKGKGASLQGEDASSIPDLIKKTFPEDHETMLAIAKAESRMVATAQNWNCHYYRTDGSRYSTSCKPEDRGKAWSVDCGVFQINMPGKVCDPALFEIEHNMKVARKIYDTQGLTAWVTYNYAQKHKLPI